MQKIFLFILLYLSFCSVSFAAPAYKVCVDVYAMSGYDSPDVGGDKWYYDVYDILSKELQFHGIVSENANDVWAEFVRSVRRDPKSAALNLNSTDAKTMYANFRKDRFDHILKFQTDRFVTYQDTGISDVAVTLTVLDSSDVNGKPLAVYKDSLTDQKSLDKTGLLRDMVKTVVNRYVHSK